MKDDMAFTAYQVLLQHFTYVVSRKPHNHPSHEELSLIPVLQMRKRGCREVKCVSPGHG